MFSAQGSAVQGGAVYIEDVFSTYLYTGNSSTQTITNEIDLAGKGGLVWIKGRSGATDHALYDTARGTTKDLVSNSTAAETTQSTGLTAFSSTGFSIGALAKLNTNTATYASWTFRKAPKFFDVVTYTGNGSNRTISHSLGSVPGCIIVKRTDTAADWQVYHRSLANTEYMVLNSTAATATGTTRWNSTTPTSSVFSLGTDTTVNASGGTYVAYLFAHNAGGFGLSGSDNVISCGLTTANGSGDFSVNLGYEPQWILIKSTGSGIWSIVDNMRGATASSGYTSSKRLQPQSSAAEDTLNSGYGIGINATGFTGNLATFSNDFIYIAIRRGPMKTPTTGTSVYNAIARTGTGAAAAVTGVGFPSDLTIINTRANITDKPFFDRLRGAINWVSSTNTGAENSTSDTLIGFDSQDGYRLGTDATIAICNVSSRTYINYSFRRAPGFFDVVCYTGTGSATTVSHNLGVVPELMIVKQRSGSATDWFVYNASIGNTFYLSLNSTAGSSNVGGSTVWNSTSPTSTVFSLGTNSTTNGSGQTYVAYLFATRPGVSKVFSYTGNGSSQTINCGFTGGARFVMVKRTDSTGDWYVWDSARGIVASNDPHLSLNSTAAEVTTDDSVDTDNTGFIVNQVAATNINVSSATYVGLAIA